MADQRGAGVGMGAYDDYVSAVVDHFWDYAEHEFGDRPQLFERSARSPHRSPVFVGGAAEHNVLAGFKGSSQHVLAGVRVAVR